MTSKTMAIVNTTNMILLKDREIIDMELKINLLNWDRKYNDIAKECYNFFFAKKENEKILYVNMNEFSYILRLKEKTYQELFNEKYAIVE